MAVVSADSNVFNAEVSKGSPVIVDFYADWCGPCRMIKPVFEKLSENYEGKVTFLKLNVDEAGDIASKFGVSSIPTVIFFKDGQPADRFLGAMPEKGIADFIQKNLK